MSFTVLPLSIAAGQALSDALEIPSNLRIVRIGTPEDWTPAALSFLISTDGADYRSVYHAAEDNEGWWPYEVVIQKVVPNSNLLLPAGGTGVLGFIKLRSGTSSRPVPQSSDRVFQILLTA